MRTLKKVLALSMVFAMAFSMMAGAAFNDQDQIDASLVEDIQLLTALEVFQGDEKGDFNPTSNVTRAQAAKMIYVLKNNGQDDEAAAFKGQSVYSDVPSGHWAEGYINYCTNLGIMSGWTEGSVRKFDPNGNVTGLELTKMLLCMIGYRSDIQGYTGNGWQTNVLRDGATSAVTTNYLPTIYNAAPRQWTARLMANAINAPYVSYSRGEVVQGSATDATVSYGEQYLGLRMVEGYLKNAGKVALNVKTASISLDEDGDTIELSGTTDLENGGILNSNERDPITKFKTTVDPMLLGQRVKVYYKNTTLTTTDAKVFAVLPTGASKVYDTTLGNVTIGKDKDKNYETIKFDGYNGGSAKQYKKANTIALVENLNTVTVLTPNDKEDSSDAAKVKNFASNDHYLGGNSNEAIRFVDQNNDGYIDLAFTDKVDYAIVGSHNASRNSIRFTNGANATKKLIDGALVNGEEAYKKINFLNDVAADDVVSVKLNCTSGKKVWDVAKIEPTTGSVSGYTLDDDLYATITLNGESTKFVMKSLRDGATNVENNADNHGLAYGIDADQNTSILNDTTFYTDGKYVIYSKGGEGVASVGNLAYLIGHDNSAWMSSKTHYVKVLLSDGTQGQYELAATYEVLDAHNNNTSISDQESKLEKTGTVAKKKDGSDFLVDGNVYSYSISNNKITLSELKSDKSDKGIQFNTAAQKYDYDKKNYEVGANKYKLSDEAYFFVKSNADNPDKAKYNVVKASELGKTLDSKKADGVYATKQNSDGMNYVVFGTLHINDNAVATSAKYAFVKSAASYAVIDGEHVAQMTVVLPDGSEQVIKKVETSVTGAKQTVSDWNDFRNKLVTYDLDSEGNVDGNLNKVVKSDSPTVEGIADENWAPVVITGWNGSSAMVKLQGTGNVELVNVASDAKIHIVDASGTNYALTEGSVEKTALNDDGSVSDKCSAYVYIQEVNGQETITDIYSADGGVSLEKMWN